MAFECVNELQARPARVEAVVLSLRTMGGSIGQADLAQLIAPDGKGAAVESVLRVLEHLGAVRCAGAEVRLEKAWREGDLEEVRWKFATGLLRAATAEDTNVRFSRFYAWLLCRPEVTHRPGDTKDVVADFNNELSLASDDGFNAEKVGPFEAWVETFGLGWIPAGFPVQPVPTDLLARDVPRAFKRKSMDAHAFVRELATRWPFLDGGAIFRMIPGHARFDTRLTPGLSAALRELHDAGVVTLETGHDVASDVKLADQQHSIMSFHKVVLRP